MNSWKPQTIGREEAIEDIIYSSRPRRNDYKYNSKASEAGLTNILQQEQEVHALQKALNLPLTTTYSTSLAHPHKPVYYNSTLLASSTQQTRVVTETDLNTESFMFGQRDPHRLNESRNIDHVEFVPSSFSFSTMREPERAKHYWNEDGYSFPNAQERSFSDTMNLQRSHLINPIRTHFDGYSSNTRRNHLEDREILLERIKEAYKIIQHQNEAIAKSDNEIVALHKQLKMLELDQEVNLQEIKTLKLENQNMEKIKSEGIKKREALVSRINQLDQDFKELSVSHNALLVECKKREGDFLQSDLKLNALEAYNTNLQQANARMQKECEMAKRQVNDIMSENKRMQLEAQQARGETALALQDKQRIAVEIAALQSASSEVNQQLLVIKSSKEKFRQELDKIKMEYNVKCNRVGLLEEEVKQQQETLVVLQHELEQSFQREARASAMGNSLWNVSFRQKMVENQLPNDNSTLADAPSSEAEKLKAQLVQKSEENNVVHEQLESVKSEHSRLSNKNKSLKEKLDYIKNVKGQLEKEIQDVSHDNESLFAEITELKEKQFYKVKHLQDELEKIKGKLTGLETEKCTLMSELQEFQQEKDKWEKEKGEMVMSLAELEAENNELRQKLKQESEKVSAESVSEEVEAIKQELDKVHKMLRLKDEELKKQNETLEEKEDMLNKLTEEATELKKGFADISSKTTSRNHMISSLGDQLEERDKRITQLEHELSAKSQQFEELCSCHTKLEMELSQSSSEALQWIAADRKKLEEQRDILRNQVLDLQCRLDKEQYTVESTKHNDEELQTLRSENAALVSRVEMLVNERDSVLQDSEDLMEGMQQLKEAFEDEIERRLEREREKFEVQQESFVEEHKNLVKEYNRTKEQHKGIDEANKSLELQCKNLEFERDELRKQVNELCENTGRTDEKTTQTDFPQTSPRRKEPRGRKRSKSVGVIVPIISIDGVDGEESTSSPDRSPTSDSPRRHKNS